MPKKSKKNRMDLDRVVFQACFDSIQAYHTRWAFKETDVQAAIYHNIIKKNYVSPAIHQFNPVE